MNEMTEYLRTIVKSIDEEYDIEAAESCNCNIEENLIHYNFSPKHLFN